MKSEQTFLWHDYETFGANPALDRPAQFAAIRTNAALEPVGEPLNWYCQPALDVFPHPIASLITGITPQDAQKKGLVEAEFADNIHAEMMEPGTCSAGYNSIHFDDEFSRNLFYRNFYDPYEREYKNNNTRWDLIDLARMCYALRPEGVEWPEHEPGKPSFKLEHLSAAPVFRDQPEDIEVTQRLPRCDRNFFHHSKTTFAVNKCSFLFAPGSGGQHNVCVNRRFRIVKHVLHDQQI
jgi:exodeoxyribonuclease-1